MKIYLLRHAQTNYNVLGLANSAPDVDVHLTDLGIVQAQQLAQALSEVRFDACYISQLPRTKQTAELVLGDRKVPIFVEPRLNDNRTGFESKPVADWLCAMAQVPDPWHARFNGGETKSEAAARAQLFLEELRQRQQETVLIVTHGFITQVLWCHLQGKALSEAAAFNLPQGTYMQFELPPDG